MKDDGLALHAPDHVEGRAGFAPKGHFEHVLADSLLKGFTKLVLDFKEAIRGA